MDFDNIFANVVAVDNIIVWAISCRGAMAAIQYSSTPIELFEKLNPWISDDVDYFIVMEACSRLIDYKSVL